MKSLREAWDCLLERSCKQERAQGHRAKTGLRLSSRSHSVVVVRVCRPLLDIVPGGSLEGSGFLGAALPAMDHANRRVCSKTMCQARLLDRGTGVSCAAGNINSLERLRCSCCLIWQMVWLPGRP